MFAKVAILVCLFGLTLAGNLYGGHGYALGSLGYSSYVAPAYTGYTAPIVKTIAPVYQAPAVSYSAPLTYAAPAVSYSTPIVKSYAAPISYSSYAPVSYGYSGYGGYGLGYGSKYLW